MTGMRIDLDSIPWQSPAVGQRFKVVESGDRALLLLVESVAADGAHPTAA